TTSRLAAGTTKAFTGAPGCTVRVTATTSSMVIGVGDVGGVVPGVVVVVVGVVVPPVVAGLLVPMTVVVSPTVVVVAPPVVVVVAGAEIPTGGPMIAGDVAAAATPAPTRISTATTAFLMIRVMRLPPAG